MRQYSSWKEPLCFCKSTQDISVISSGYISGPLHKTVGVKIVLNYSCFGCEQLSKVKFLTNKVETKIYVLSNMVFL